MNKRRNWSDDEKREIYRQKVPPGGSVAQVARRYAMNANMVYTWMKDPRQSAFTRRVRMVQHLP